MFKRELAQQITNDLKSFPCLLLTGPRQSGKTTLLKTLLPDYQYLTLESPDVLARVNADPRGTIEQYLSQGMIIDEAQNSPAIFSYIQEYVDQSQEMGHFVLSGSQNFLLSEAISQSLAGRVSVLELLPLSYQEYASQGDEQISVWNYLFQGGYPRIYKDSISPDRWYNSYIRTYLERDVRSLLSIKELGTFQTFLKLAAARHGQLLNLSDIATQLGVSQPTVKSWLSVLEASYISKVVKPYYRNFNKRLVKTPKLYFYDSAIVSQLLGIHDPGFLFQHAMRGAIFEGWCFAEITKYFLNQAKPAEIYFWRDQMGVEVDFILEGQDTLIGIECKSGKTIAPDAFDVLEVWSAQLSSKTPVIKVVVYAGDESYQQNDVHVVGWRDLTKKLPEIMC